MSDKTIMNDLDAARKGSGRRSTAKVHTSLILGKQRNIASQRNIMAPWERERKEKLWKRFHQGKGSVIQRARTKSGRSYLTFITPSGERLDSWKKAQTYMRISKQVVKAEADGDQDAKLAKRPLSQKYRSPKLSWCDRREFREWFWRKKGGTVTKKEYADKNFPNRGRWETKYILLDQRKIFRSWKECVKFLGFNPELSSTSWALHRLDEDSLPRIKVIPQSSNLKRMRGQFVSSPTSIIAAPTSNSITKPTKFYTVLNPFSPTDLRGTSKYVGHQKGLLQESEDSSTDLRLTLQSKPGFGAKIGGDMRWCNTGFSLGDEDLGKTSSEEKGVKSDSEMIMRVANFATDQKNSVSSWIGKKNELLNRKTGRRRRVLILNSTSEEVTEVEDMADRNVSNDEGPSTAHPRVMNQMSAKRSEKAQSGGKLRISSLDDISNENFIDTSEKEDQNQKHMKHSQKNIISFYEESKNGGSNEEVERAVVSFDDETLQRNLINLLYADHIRQSSKQIKGNVIGKLYAEFIERSFARNQNSNSGLLNLVASGSKEDHHHSRRKQ